MTQVKICGITNLKDAQLARKFGANFVGFIFYEPSPRYITPTEAKLIIAKIGKKVLPVGVFVNASLKTVREIARYCGIKILQLHGSESPAYCDTLRKEGFKVIKALRIKGKGPLKNISRYDYKVNAFLFDTYSPKTFGGTGRTFNWKILKCKFSAPIFLSGGINAKNVQAAIRAVQPYAVDASSSLEQFPGKKSHRLLRQFFNRLPR
jgi:phosphoribosylanthranilate isomerase